jgi:ATP phosphoribosyltransferase regulatory subunit HisZ
MGQDAGMKLRRIGTTALAVLCGGLLLLLAAIAATFFILINVRPDYDVADPDYLRYSEIFAEFREKSAAGTLEGTVLDLSELNGGAWSTACLFGGYTDPVGAMLAKGAEVDSADKERLPRNGFGARIAAVEEYELLIAYVDSGNRAHFIHFRDGLGPEGQHLQKCAQKPRTTILLDERVSLR